MLGLGSCTPFDELPLASSKRIVAWSVEIDEVPHESWQHLASLLSPEEQARAARFVFHRHRREHVAAHALKRLMLSHHGGGAPEAWAFKTGLHGKPMVADASHLHFNMSHCEGLVACAVGLRAPVGIDVERRGRAVRWDVATSHFAVAEHAWLEGLPEGARQDGLLRIWTLKEAFIKATGLGLAQKLDEFAISFDPLHLGFSDPALGDPATWRLHQGMAGARCIFAAAWQPGPETIEVAPVRLETLLDRLAARSSLQG